MIDIRTRDHSLKPAFLTGRARRIRSSASNSIHAAILGLLLAGAVGLAAKAGPMPAHERLGPDDSENLKD